MLVGFFEHHAVGLPSHQPRDWQQILRFQGLHDLLLLARTVGMIGRFADDRDFQLYFVLKRAERFEGVRNALALAEIGGEQDAQRLVGRPAARAS